VAQTIANDTLLATGANTPVAEARYSLNGRKKPLRAWDGFDAYLFDIDGTLLRSRDRVHYSSFAESLFAVTGLQGTLDGIALHGNTDTAILQEVLRRQNIPASEAAALIPRILDAMRQIVFAKKHTIVVYPMPGVFATLEHLRLQHRLLGLGTGNLESIGWLKTEICGLRDYFTFGAFSDLFAQRAALIANGAEQARSLAGTQARICVVGDTPMDIAAAHTNSLPVIAVATGAFTLEQLSPYTPDFAVSTLQGLTPESSPTILAEP